MTHCGHQPNLFRLSLRSLLSTNLELDLGHINDKAKPAERRGRKAGKLDCCAVVGEQQTGLRFYQKL